MTVFIFVIKNTSANNLRHSLKLQHTSRKFRKLTIENMKQIKLIYYKENCPRNTRRLEIITRKIIYLLFRIVECVLFS